MVAIIHTGWLSQVLRLMPAGLHTALDRWSYRLALRRAAERRSRGTRRSVQESVAPAYQLRPWRD